MYEWMVMLRDVDAIGLFDFAHDECALYGSYALDVAEFGE